MRRGILTVISLATLVTASACGTSKEEQTATGAGTGVAAGALLGGPVGAVVGAGAGALAGNQEENVEKEASQAKQNGQEAPLKPAQ